MFMLDSFPVFDAFNKGMINNFVIKMQQMRHHYVIKMASLQQKCIKCVYNSNFVKVFSERKGTTA